MGACCTGKEGRHDNKQEIYTKYTNKNSNLELKSDRFPIIDLDIEKSTYNTSINNFINNDNFKYIKIVKYNIEQLYNITKYLQDDHTNSEYILYDLRETNKRKESFMKKFRMINYSIEEIKMLNESGKSRLKKYLQDKRILVICPENKLEQLEMFLFFISDNNYNCKVYLLDVDLENINSNILVDKVGINSSSLNLLNLLELKNYKDFPFILLAFKFFPHLKSDSFVFIDYYKVNKTNKLSNEYIATNKENVKMKEFINSFKISTNLQFINNNDNNLQNKSNKYKDAPLKVLQVTGINQVSDLISKKMKILEMANIAKYEILSNISVLVQIDDEIRPEVVVYIIFILVWKLCDLPIKKLIDYIKDNYLFVKELKDFNSDKLKK
jgi:hypothetical protein